MVKASRAQKEDLEGILMDMLENERNPYIRQAIAFHESASEEVLLKAVEDTDYMVRIYALHNPNSTSKVFEAATARKLTKQG